MNSLQQIIQHLLHSCLSGYTLHQHLTTVAVSSLVTKSSNSHLFSRLVECLHLMWPHLSLLTSHQSFTLPSLMKKEKVCLVLLCCAFNVLNWTSFEKVKGFNWAVKPLSDRHTSSVFSSLYSSKVWHICSVTLKANFSNVSTSLWWFLFPFLREPYGDAVLTTADQRWGKG